MKYRKRTECILIYNNSKLEFFLKLKFSNMQNNKQGKRERRKWKSTWKVVEGRWEQSGFGVGDARRERRQSRAAGNVGGGRNPRWE